APIPPPPASLSASDEVYGTGLSWDPSPGSATYSIERAPYLERTVAGIQAPPRLPNGYRPDLPPMVTAATTSTSASIPGPFVTIGTSTGTSFIDRSAVRGARYLYRVVAQTPLGARSQPSNIVEHRSNIVVFSASSGPS